MKIGFINEKVEVGDTHPAVADDHLSAGQQSFDKPHHGWELPPQCAPAILRPCA